jgi:GT2 family glycosyltransferase
MRMLENRQTEGCQPSDITEKTEAEQRGFYEAVLARAHEAERTAGLIVRQVEIAGVRIGLCFAGPRLEQAFMPALAHIEVSACPGDRPPDAEFHIFDSRSTGVAMVPPPCGRSAFTDRGDIWGFTSTRFRTAFHWSELSVCVLDHTSNIGAYWVEDAAALPYWTRSSPLRTLFHWLLATHGLQLVHAAVVGTEAGAILVTGKGGVGKSSTALASLVDGMAYVGDDYLVVGLDPVPTAYSLYSTAKLTPSQAARFPQLTGLVDGQGAEADEKVVLTLHPAREAQIARSLPIRFVVTPRFGSVAETTFEPVAELDLHRAATFTTMAQLPHAGVETFDFMQRLIERTEIRRIVLGHDLLAVPQAIRRLLADEMPLCDDARVRLGRQPLVSVIIPVFNGAHFLHEAVASILAQDYPALEIIVVDDGSTDDIEAAVAALPIDVRFIRQFNAGPSVARNTGIHAASGEYIAFLDVDDLWPRGNLAGMVAHMEQAPGVDVLHGRAQLARITTEEPAGYRFIGDPNESFGSYVGAGLFRAAVFRTNGLFDPSMRFGEDADWFNRAREGGAVLERLEQITLIVRRHEANMTRGRSARELNTLLIIKKALDRRAKRPIVQAISGAG